MSIDSPLKPFLHDDAEFPGLAQQSSARIRSVGYPKPVAELRPYSGAIEGVPSARVAVVGTSSAVRESHNDGAADASAAGTRDRCRDDRNRGDLVASGCSVLRAARLDRERLRCRRARARHRRCVGRLQA